MCLVELQRPGRSILLADLVLCIEAACGHVAVDGLPLFLESFCQAMSGSPTFQGLDAVVYFVIVEVLHQQLDIGRALLGVGAIDTAQGYGRECRGASPEDLVDVNVYEECSMVRVDHSIEGEGNAASGIPSDDLGSEDVVDAASGFASGDFRVRAMLCLLYTSPSLRLP